jgi:membrane protease YdiL (CAAX protease family)/NAD-dependent dihydropyrimidine dehydrogenase PreA subunit
MSAKSAHLTLRPDRCNECGKCVSACPSDAIRVGGDYILVDWHACNQCCACIEACDNNAIQRAIMPLRSSSAVASVAPADVAKVVVGSRAEAKAVRKSAEQAAKQAARDRGKLKPAPVAAVARAAAAPVAAATSVAASGAAAVSALGPRASSAATSAATPDRPAPSPKAEWTVLGATWTLTDALIMLGVLLVTLMAKIWVLGLPAVALMPAAGRAFTRAGVLTVYYGVQVGALVLLVGRHNCTFAEAFGLQRRADTQTAAATERPAVGVTVLITLGLLVGVEAVAIAYGLIAQAVGWRQPVTLSADVSTVFGGGGAGVLLSVLLVALIAPVVEELAFRGVILPAVGLRWGEWPAILVSGALFAAYHVNLWLFVPMLALGTALGWLTVSRRSLWPALALHVIYNSLAVAAAFIVPR